MEPSQTVNRSYQGLLPLLQPPTPTLENFVVGANAQALAAVRGLPASGGLVYLWGDTGSGRSHLLTAFATEQGVSVLAPSDLSALRAAGFPLAGSEDSEEAPPALVVDDVDALDVEAQVALFDAINRLRGSATPILCAGPVAPPALALRGELTSRLAQGLVFRLERLDEAQKRSAMAAYTRDLGFELPAEVADFLLRHGRRDLGALLAAARRIDERSIREQRPVNVRLAREVLQSADLFSG